MSEMPEIEDANVVAAPATLRTSSVQVGKYSDVGQLREINEDSFLHLMQSCVLIEVKKFLGCSL